MSAGSGKKEKVVLKAASGASTARHPTSLPQAAGTASGAGTAVSLDPLPVPKKESPKPAKWSAQIAEGANLSPGGELRHRQRALKTRIGRSEPKDSPPSGPNPQLKRLSTHCHHCREQFVPNANGEDVAKFCAWCGQQREELPDTKESKTTIHVSSDDDQEVLAAVEEEEKIQVHVGMSFK